MDVNGATSSAEIPIEVDGQAKIGVFKLSFTDVSVPVSGIPITVTRTYDSRVKARRDFGVGWTLDVAAGHVDHNRTPGEGWSITQGPPPFGFACSVVDELVGHTTTVRLSDLESYSFAPSLTNLAATVGACLADVEYHQVGGWSTGATLEVTSGTSVVSIGGSNLVDEVTGLLYNPTEFLLTTPDGRKLTVNAARGVTRIEDPNGSSLNVNPSGLVSSTGKSISFGRDSAGRITSITDPMGSVLHYAYDASGDLVEFVDQEENHTTFAYDAQHNLQEIYDPLGSRAVRSDYDAAGRLVSVTDALGHATQISHDLNARVETVTDRLSHVSTIEYDAHGNVIRKLDPLGHATSFTYDAQGNELSSTDPLGRTVRSTYDSRRNRLTFTDGEGRTSTSTYDLFGNEVTRIDPLGKTWNFAFDSRGNFLGDTDPMGHASTRTLDATSHLVTAMTDPLGHRTRYENDASGNVLRVINPLGRAVTSTYDANGRLLTRTATRTTPAGSAETLTGTFSYDRLGRVTLVIQPDGSTVQFAYWGATAEITEKVDADGYHTLRLRDPLGRHVGTLYPDGSSDSVAYDASGEVVSQTDRGGRTTSFVRDALGRVTRVTHPDNGHEDFFFDAAGQLEHSTDAAGIPTYFTYDRTGRLRSQTDAQGHTSWIAYDAAGRETTRTDALGHTTTKVYDDAGRHVSTRFHDGTTTTFELDAEGRVVVERDQAGEPTTFTYDASDALAQVIDAEGHATSYIRDELGHVVRQTDPLGRATRLDYDPLGRLVKRTLPLGQFETFTYNGRGLVLSRTDFNGVTNSYSYDALGRRIRADFGDGSSVVTTYGSNGLLGTVTDARGVTSYSYDTMNRLASVIDPDGRQLGYTYDSRGLRTTLVAPYGTMSFGYDSLRRLQEVHDVDGSVTTFSYDAVGNRIGVSRPNGVTTEATFDALNRPHAITHRNSSNSVLASFLYELGPAGTRTAITEADGRRVDYTYDHTYQLRSETVTGGVGAGSTFFSYDANGNRASEATASGTRSYTYDANDRLLSDGVASYTFDANGNMRTRTSSAGATTFTWDAQDRLVAVATPLHGIQNVYDAQGLRVRRVVDGVGTDYLVDRNRGFGDVLEERGPGSPVRYLYGEDLVRETAGISAVHRLTDALGTTRALTNAAGAVSQRYEFSAFGAPLMSGGGTRYQFGGEQSDAEDGLYYLRARYYSPSLGRFLSQDPLRRDNRDPMASRMYQYGRNSPPMFVDPSGAFEMGSVMVSVAIVGVTAAIAVPNYASAVGRGKDVVFLDFNHLPPEYSSTIWQVGYFLPRAFAETRVGFKTGPSGTTKRLDFPTPAPVNFNSIEFMFKRGVGAGLKLDAGQFPICGKEGAVWVDQAITSMFWYFLKTRSPPDFDQGIAETAAHEVGHAFGMRHRREPASLMWAFSEPDEPDMRWEAFYHRYFDDTDLANMAAAGCSP